MNNTNNPSHSTRLIVIEDHAAVDPYGRDEVVDDEMPRAFVDCCAKKRDKLGKVEIYWEANKRKDKANNRILCSVTNSKEQ